METFGPHHYPPISPSSPLWTEIPNYEQHVFHPIPMSGSMAKTDDPSVEIKLPTRRRATQPDIADLQSTFKRQSLSETNLLLHRNKITRHTVIVTEPESEPTEEQDEDSSTSSNSDDSFDYASDQYDDEISRLIGAPINSLDGQRRCSAPTPVTMMRGKSTPNMGGYIAEREANKKAQQKKASKEKKPHKGSSGRRRRDPPPRPAGLPPLKLDDLNTRLTSTESPTMSSPRLVSPRVQKPITPRRPSDPLIVPSAGPDCSRAMPSIQSPRSAFSARDLILIQRS